MLGLVLVSSITSVKWMVGCQDKNEGWLKLQWQFDLLNSLSAFDPMVISLGGEKCAGFKRIHIYQAALVKRL